MSAYTDAALAAAVGRATRAEADLAMAKALWAVDMRAARTAEAQVAKVRAAVGALIAHLAALGSVGATEGEAGESGALDLPTVILCALLDSNAEPNSGDLACEIADAVRANLSARADGPRACPRPEAHHYQPGTQG